jgi:hypothetical protein
MIPVRLHFSAAFLPINRVRTLAIDAPTNSSRTAFSAREATVSPEQPSGAVTVPEATNFTPFDTPRALKECLLT